MGDSFQQFISNMKAAVIFISLLVVCSSHVIKKRSLLGGGQSHGHGHHGNHQQHHRQQHQAKQPFGQRAGRDGDHHQDDSENEIRAAPTGYLPATDDYEYEEDLAGYNTDQPGTRSDDLGGYGDDDLSGHEDGAGAEERGQDQYDDEQGQYEDDQYQYEEGSGEDELPEGAGSASNIDNSYAAPDAGRAADDGYGAPEEEAAPREVDRDYSAPPEHQDQGRAADEGYGAPAGAAAESDYSAPRAAEEEYGAPGQYEGSQGGFPFAIVEGRQGSGTGAAAEVDKDTKVCPGGSLDICVSVFPGITARVYGACVQGCAHRCRE